MVNNMFDFEEELKKFHPSLEIEDAQEAIYNQDLVDMADVMIKTMRDAASARAGQMTEPLPRL
ncbi:MAG: hypothetical protein J6P87_01010 [Lachnospiraceae bacterium]|nr:hypothetical protein [Lachnospiraceae bacterium]